MRLRVLMRGGDRRIVCVAAAVCYLLAQLTAVAHAAADAEKSNQPKWGPDNPKPFLLKYHKYVGPFMAM